MGSGGTSCAPEVVYLKTQVRLLPLMFTGFNETDYSDEELRATYTVLASQIGNLVSRLHSDSLIRKITLFQNTMRIPKLDLLLVGLREKMESSMDRYDTVEACESILEVIAAVSPPCRYSSAG